MPGSCICLGQISSLGDSKAGFEGHVHQKADD